MVNPRVIFELDTRIYVNVLFVATLKISVDLSGDFLRFMCDSELSISQSSKINIHILLTLRHSAADVNALSLATLSLTCPGIEQRGTRVLF